MVRTLFQHLPEWRERSLPTQAFVGTLPEGNKPLFYGCAYCRKVKTDHGGTPAITPAAIPDRWLVRGSFDHAKHATTACIQCHDAAKSLDTADMILPFALPVRARF